MRNKLIPIVSAGFLLTIGLVANADDSKFGDHGSPSGAKTAGSTSPFQSVASAPEANLFTGAASTKVEIVVPPGRDKMTPKVWLEYSSDGGRDVVGYGWSVATARISRSTKNGVPRFTDSGTNPDQFVLDLNGSANDLSWSSGNIYKPRVEGSYLRILYVAGSDTWTVLDRDGTTYYFGKMPAERLGTNTSVSSGTSVWLLSKVQDFAGNTIEYFYSTIGISEPQPGLITEIRYGGHVSGTPAFQYKVTFEYDSRIATQPWYPTRASVSFSNGFANFNQARLKKVTTWAKWRGDDGDFDVVREYSLQHEVDDTSTDSGGWKRSGTGITTLAAVGLTAYGMNDASVTANPTVFDYSPPVPLVCSGGIGMGCSTNSDCALYQAGTCTARPGWSSGNGWWNSLPRSGAPSAKGGRFRDRAGNDGKAQFDTLDLNGDSIVDYIDVLSNTPNVRFGEVSSDGRPALGAISPWHWPHDFPHETQQINEDTGDIHLSVFDIDGDSLPELVDTNQGRCNEACGYPNYAVWCVYHETKDPVTNWPNGFNDTPDCWTAPRNAAGQPINAIQEKQDKSVVADVIDFDGDGLPDVVSSQSGGWAYAENLGNGFAAPVIFSLPPQFYSYVGLSQNAFAPIDCDSGPQQWVLLDINGDGLRDIVITGDGNAGSVNHLDGETKWGVVYNEGGFRRSPQGTTFANVVHPWEVQGSYGLPDKIAVYSADGYATISALIDMNGDGLPDLLRRHAQGTQTPSPNEISYRCDSDGSGPSLSDSGQTLSKTACYNMLVFYNTGSSFAPPSAWRSPATAIRADYEECVSSTDLGGCYGYMDFNGDGLVDFVANAWGGEWGFMRHPSSPRIGNSSDPRTKPNLMTAMMNGLGGETLLTYTSLSYGGDRGLPYPYWMVEEISNKDVLPGDDVSKPFTFYLYDGAWFDNADREFRGFSSVRGINRLGLSTISEFHQDDRRKGKLFRKTTLGAVPATCQGEVFTSDTNVCDPSHYALAVENYDWGPEQSYPANHAPMTNPVQKLSETVTPYHPGRSDNNQSPTLVTSLRKKTTYSYDDYGNELTRVLTAGGAPFSTTTNTYWPAWVSDSAGIYVTSRPKTSDTNDDVHGMVVNSLKFVYYNDSPSSSLGGNAKVKVASVCADLTSGSCNLSTDGAWSDTSFAYDRWGNLLTRTSPIGTMMTLAYGKSIQYAERITDDTLLGSVLYYDTGIGQVYETTNPDGLVVDQRYDGLGRPTKKWTNAGNSSGMASHATPFSESSPLEENVYANPGGCSGTTSCTPTTPGYVERRTMATPGIPSAPPAVAFYDGFGRILAVKQRIETTGNSRPTVVSGLRSYNAAGQVVTEGVSFQSSSSDTIHTYSAFDRVTNAPAATVFQYDEHGRLVLVTAPDGAVTSYGIDEPGVRLTVDANLSSGEIGAATIEIYDAMGRKIREKTCSAIPARPYRSCPSSSGITWTEYEYDALDREIAVTQVDANSPLNERLLRETQYNGLGKVSKTLNYDAGPVSGGPGITEYFYNPRGDLVTLTRPDGVQTVNILDSFGRVFTTSTIKDGRESNGVTFRYGTGNGAAGRVTNVVVVSSNINDAQTVTSKRLSYNRLGRVRQEKIKVSSQEYGALKLKMTYVRDEADRLVSTIYPGRSGSGLSYSTVTTTWNDLGQPTGLTNSSGATYVSDVDYDIYGHIVRTQYGNGVQDFASYDTPGHNLRLKCLSTTSASRNSDPACQSFNSSTDYQSLSYAEYDAMGRITSIADKRASNSAAGNSQDYVYDAIGRLVETTYISSPAGVDNFRYDQWGNMYERLGVDPQSGQPLYKHHYDDSAHSHRLTQFGSEILGYDDNGSQKQRGANTYAYDGLDRLIYAETSTDYESNVFDESGFRSIRDEDGEIRHSFSGGLVEVTQDTLRRHFAIAGRVVAFDTVDVPAGIWKSPPAAGWTTSAGRRDRMQHDRIVARDQFLESSVVQWHATAAMLLVVGLMTIGSILVAPSQRARVAGVTAMLILGPTFVGSGTILGGAQVAEAATSPTTYYYHKNHLGSVQLLTKDTGSVIDERISYRAYGQTRCVDATCSGGVQPTNATRAFTGHDNDGGTGLVYMGARHYDPVVGGFLTFDPAGQYASPYAYVGNNPTNAVDRDGQYGEELIAAAITAATVAATVTFIDSMIQTRGDFGKSIRAAGIAGFTTSLGPVGTIINASVSHADIGKTVMVNAIPLYGIAESFDDGNFVTGAVGILGIILAAAAGLSEAFGGTQSGATALGESGGGEGGSVEELGPTVLQDMKDEGQLPDFNANGAEANVSFDNRLLRATQKADGTIGLTKIFNSESDAQAAKLGQEWGKYSGLTVNKGGTLRATIYGGSTSGRFNFDLGQGVRMHANFTATEAIRRTLAHEYWHVLRHASEIEANWIGLRGAGKIP